MFSLIITIISIALVAVLALATLYYGGKSFLQGQAAATAATVINTGQQVSGAYTLWQTDNPEGSATLPVVLSANYLKTIPTVKGVAWREVSASSGWLLLPKAVTQDACIEFNKKIHKLDGIPELPVEGVSKLCYGSEAKGYSVVWRMGTSGATLATAVSAISGGNDGAGAPIVSADITPTAPADANWIVTPTTQPSGEFAGLGSATPPPPPSGGGSTPPTAGGFVYPTRTAEEAALFNHISASNGTFFGGLPFDSATSDNLAGTNDHYGLSLYTWTLPAGWELDATYMGGSGIMAYMPTNCPTRTSVASECDANPAYRSLYPPEFQAINNRWRMRGYHNRSSDTGSYNAPGYAYLTFVESSTLGSGAEHRVQVWFPVASYDAGVP